MQYQIAFSATFAEMQLYLQILLYTCLYPKGSTYPATMNSKNALEKFPVFGIQWRIFHEWMTQHAK